jgi:CspA family cold shock protein
MTEGTVKFFDAAKQFGFINGDDGKSYYVHANEVEQGASLTEGDRVSFTPAQGERGPKAEKVKKLAKSGSKAEAEAEQADSGSENPESEEAAEEEASEAEASKEEAEEKEEED